MKKDLFQYSSEREAESAAKVRALEALLIEKGVIGSDSVDTEWEDFRQQLIRSIRNWEQLECASQPP